MKPREQDEAEIKTRIASDSSHWYRHTGEACHEVENKSKPGEFRTVTKTDAKKLKLVPSVTNILSRSENKSGLDDWKRNMIYDQLKDRTVLDQLDTALKTGDEQAFDAICKGMDEAAKAVSLKAADLGSQFHHAADLLVGSPFMGHEEISIATGVNILVATNFRSAFDHSIVKQIAVMAQTGHAAILSERSVAWNELAHGSEFGVGGRIDLLATIKAEAARKFAMLHQVLSLYPETRAFVDDRIKRGLDINILIDWKTRKPNRKKQAPELFTFPVYASDVAQLAAYGSGVKRSLLIPVHLHLSILVPSDYLMGEAASGGVVHRVFCNSGIEHGLNYFHSCITRWRMEELLLGGDFAPLVPES